MPPLNDNELVLARRELTLLENALKDPDRRLVIGNRDKPLCVLPNDIIGMLCIWDLLDILLRGAKDKLLAAEAGLLGAEDD